MKGKKTLSCWLLALPSYPFSEQEKNKKDSHYIIPVKRHYYQPKFQIPS